MKKTWSILREVIGKKSDKSSFPQEFKIDHDIVTNRATIAESFNNYFSTIVSKTGQNAPHTPIYRLFNGPSHEHYVY